MTDPSSMAAYWSDGHVACWINESLCHLGSIKQTRHYALAIQDSWAHQTEVIGAQWTDMDNYFFSLLGTDLGQVEMYQMTLQHSRISSQARKFHINFRRLSSHLCHQLESVIDSWSCGAFALVAITWCSDIFMCVSANASKLLHPWTSQLNR